MFVKFSDDDIQNINDINTTVLDVRTPEEYKAGHAVGAINVPLATIESESTTLDKNKHYVTYCSQGIRSLLAKKKMEKLGFTNVQLRMTTCPNS